MKLRWICSWVFCAAVAAPAQEASSRAAGETPSTGSVSGAIVSPKVRTRGQVSDRDIVLYLVPKTLPAKPAGEVVAKDEKAAMPGEGQTIRITQKALNFVPHVLPVPAGAKVEFLNEDKLQHNVRSSGACCRLDQDMDPGGKTTVKLCDEGVETIRCRIHPEMAAHLVVVPTTHYVTVSVERVRIDGKRLYRAAYTLQDVPPGDYTLKTWSKVLEPVTKDVRIEAGKDTELDLEFKRQGRRTSRRK